MPKESRRWTKGSSASQEAAGRWLWNYQRELVFFSRRDLRKIAENIWIQRIEIIAFKGKRRIWNPDLGPRGINQWEKPSS